MAVSPISVAEKNCMVKRKRPLAGAFSGASRIRTGDLLGAMHEGRLMGSPEKRSISSAFAATRQRP